MISSTTMQNGKLKNNEIELRMNDRPNFLEYMSIEKGITTFIKQAEKGNLNVRPHRPQMLDLIFSQRKRLSINL